MVGLDATLCLLGLPMPVRRSAAIIPILVLLLALLGAALSRFEARPALRVYRLAGVAALAVVLALLLPWQVWAAPGGHVSSEDFNLAAGNSNALGITWDGTYFRVTDRNDGKVYAYNASGVYVSTQDFNLAAANSHAHGIAWDGTYFRVMDTYDDKVYAYNASGVYVSTQDFNLAAANSNPRGITWDGTHLKVADEVDGKVYAYNASGVYVSTQDFNLAAANSSPRGITWDGAHFGVADEVDDKVYAYNASGAYVSTQDFNLAAANNQAYGITWDGTYLRVTDPGGNKVYSYEQGTPPSGLSLSALSVTPGALTPAFTSENSSYTVTVANAVSSVTVSATATDATASVSGTGAHSLTVGNNDIDVVVTATGGDTWTYNVRVRRMAPIATVTLSALSVPPGTLTPAFSGAVTSYTATVDSDIASVTVSATGPGTSSVTGTGAHILALGSNAIEVVVTNQDGFTTQTYTITVTREVGDVGSHEWDDNVLTLHLHPLEEPTSGLHCAKWDDDVRVLNRRAHLYALCGGSGSNSAEGQYYPTMEDGEQAFDFLGVPSYTWKQEGGTTIATWTSGTVTEKTDGPYSSAAPYFSARAGAATGGLGTLPRLEIELTMSDDLLTTGTPAAPGSVVVSRSADFATATVQWDLFDPVSEYELQREEATTVNVGDISRIEYGNPRTFMVDGTFAGVDTYADISVDTGKTYQYRVRAMGAEWGAWSQWVFVSADPAAQKVDDPSNLQLDRAQDNSQVTVSWTAPAGAVDNYTLQREEFVDGIFANVMSIAASGSDWLPGDSTTYTDSAILPGRTYRYRVAGVRDDVVGEYSEWASSGPVDLTFGLPPMNLRVGDDQRHDDRREYWMVWDAVDGADDYELEVNAFDLHTGTLTMEDDLVVRDPTYFATAFERREYRVRGRKQDADLCGSGADDYCPTDWTGWFSVPFVPVVVEPSPQVLTTPVAPSADVMAARTALEGFVEGLVEPSGFTVDPGDVIDLAVLVLGLVGAGGAFLKSHRSGMAPLGVGAGVAWFILVLVLGIRLVDLPVIWAVVSLVVVLVLGILTLVMSLGLGRGE